MATSLTGDGTQRDATVPSSTGGAPVRQAQQKEASAQVLDAMLGAGAVAALRAGFLRGGDFRAAIPLLAGHSADLRGSAQAALVAVCGAGHAAAAALLLDAGCVESQSCSTATANFAHMGLNST